MNSLFTILSSIAVSAESSTLSSLPIKSKSLVLCNIKIYPKPYIEIS